MTIRVFYPYTTVPEYPLIAESLRDELGWEPALWIAPSNQRAEVAQRFPAAVFQTVEDAVYGRAIRGLNTVNPPVPDRGFWERMQSHLSTLMGMMDYYGPPDVFPYPERERFARNLILQWNEIVLRLNPGIVCFKEAPHLPHTTALHALCTEYGIPAPFFVPTIVPTFSLIKDQLDGPPLRLAEQYSECLANPGAYEIHPEIRAAADLVIQGDVFTHEYMTRQAEAEMDFEVEAEPEVVTVVSGRSTSLWASIRGVFRPLPSSEDETEEHSVPSTTDDEERQRLSQTSEWILLKFPGHDPGNPPFTLGDYEAYQEVSAKRKALLKSDYLSRCTDVVPENDDYVYFALHYQPERTTSADGGIFKDQFLAAAMLHEALPEGWLLYVKEHPSQFARALHGDKGRTTDLYRDLEKLERVRLVPHNVSSKRLALNARAVATITGTLAWEAALNHRPALVFGEAWYEGLPGAYRIESADAARLVLEGLRRGVDASWQDVDVFLEALSAAAFRMELNAWCRPTRVLSIEEQVAGAVSALRWWAEHRLVRSAQTNAPPT